MSKMHFTAILLGQLVDPLFFIAAIWVFIKRSPLKQTFVFAAGIAFISFVIQAMFSFAFDASFAFQMSAYKFIATALVLCPISYFRKPN